MNKLKAMARTSRAQAPGPGSASSKASSSEKSQSEEEPALPEPQEQQHTIVAEEATHDNADQDTDMKEADHEGSKKNANMGKANDEAPKQHNRANEPKDEGPVQHTIVEEVDGKQPEGPSNSDPKTRKIALLGEDVPMEDPPVTTNDSNQADPHLEAAALEGPAVKTASQAAPVEGKPMADSSSGPHGNHQTDKQLEATVINSPTAKTGPDPAPAEDVPMEDSPVIAHEGNQADAEPEATVIAGLRAKTASQTAPIGGTSVDDRLADPHKNHQPVEQLKATVIDTPTAELGPKPAPAGDVTMDDHPPAPKERNKTDTQPEVAGLRSTTVTDKAVFQPAIVEDASDNDHPVAPKETSQTGTRPKGTVVNDTTTEVVLQPAIVEDTPMGEPVTGPEESKQTEAQPKATAEGSFTPQATPQPAIVEEEQNQALQPSIAPEHLLKKLQALETATNDAQEESFQPSIDPADMPRATPNADHVRDWLQNTDDTSQQLSPDEAVDSLETRDDDGLMMPVEDKARLERYIDDNYEDTPEPEDERAFLSSPPVNRHLERVRRADRRPSSHTGKRKRGNSSAGRRSKSRSVSRGPKGEGVDLTKRSSRELPRRDEFNPSQTQRLGPDNYEWGVKPPTPPLDTTNLKNLGVRDVNPLDDNDEGDTRYRGTLGSRTVVPWPRPDPISPESPPAPPRPQRTSTQPRSRRRKLPTQRPPTPMDVDEEIESETAPKTINDLPREVYSKIFRELLLSDVQIYVYQSWSKVYPSSRHRNKFNIEPAILRVCKRAYWEGIRVLYGENIFVYSLRDAPTRTAKPPADVEQLAQDDSSTQNGAGEEGDDDGSEYQDDGADMYADEEEQVTSRRRRRAVKDWEGDIRIAKYFSLFRRIIIEAEHNRFGAETKQSMAVAINFWKDPPLSQSQPLIPISPPLMVQGGNETAKSRTRGSKKIEPKPEKPQKSNIHTLAIRIFPSKKISNEMATFTTFVSFFTADSPVIESLQTILPQFTRLEINWKYLNPRSRPTCLSLDMRHLYIRRNVAGGHRDVWRRDKLMQQARDEGVSRAMSALGRLAERLEAHCEKHLPKEQEVDPYTGLVVADDWELVDDEEWWPQVADGEFVEA